MYILIFNLFDLDDTWYMTQAYLLAQGHMSQVSHCPYQNIYWALSWIWPVNSNSFGFACRLVYKGTKDMHVYLRIKGGDCGGCTSLLVEKNYKKVIFGHS